MHSRKATNRLKLIEAAAYLIDNDGYKNIDVTKVTKQAKLGYGTFYNHFSDITELFEAIAKEVIVSIQKHVTELAGDETRVLKQIFMSTIRLSQVDISRSQSIESPKSLSCERIVAIFSLVHFLG